MAAALDRGESELEPFQFFLRVLASHFDVTGPSVNFNKLYGCGVAAGPIFAKYPREYAISICKVTGPGRQTGRTVNMLVEIVRLGVNTPCRALREENYLCFPPTTSGSRTKELKRCGNIFGLVNGKNLTKQSTRTNGNKFCILYLVAVPRLTLLLLCPGSHSSRQ